MSTSQLLIINYSYAPTQGTACYHYYSPLGATLTFLPSGVKKTTLLQKIRNLFTIFREFLD